MKKVITLLFSIYLCLSAFPLVYADSMYWNNTATGYHCEVIDGADLLTEQEEKKLLEEMKPITAYGNAVIETTEYNYGTPRQYAENHHPELNHISETYFLIDMSNREIWLYNGGDIEKTVNASYATLITDNIYTYASNGDYYTCCSKAMEQVINLMEGRSISQPMRYICAILLALIIGLLISYMIVWQTRKKTQSTPIPKKAELTTGAVAITAAGLDVYRRVTRSSGSGSSSSGGGFSGGGGGGGGGGGFSGGGHSF